MKRRLNKKGIIALILLVIILLTPIITIVVYFSKLKPVTNKNVIVEFKVEEGDTLSSIAGILEEKELIKSKTAYKIYLKTHDVKDIKIGKYELNQNMGVKKIIETLSGDNYKEDYINITFKEGLNIRQIAEIIDEETDNTKEDVFNLLKDESYIDSLINEYWFLTDDIKNEDIYYPLEGYLFPDTYEFKNKDVTIPEIIKKLLDQMDIVLTPYKNKIEIDKYDVHELLTLASIAEKEVSNKSSEDDRKKVVSVFINRLDKKMALGSDITTRYAIKLDESRPLKKSEYADNSPYNTRNSNNTGFIPSPICMVSKNSIEAVIDRIDTNYLFFISNINTGETFFYEYSKDFEIKKQELSKVNGGY